MNFFETFLKLFCYISTYFFCVVFLTWATVLEKQRYGTNKTYIKVYYPKLCNKFMFVPLWNIAIKRQILIIYMANKGNGIDSISTALTTLRPEPMNQFRKYRSRNLIRVFIMGLGCSRLFTGI